jgi:hypothetical protein
MREWRRHFFYTKASIRTTWKLRVATLIVVILTGVLTRGFWAAEIGRSLVCTGELAPSDMILLENFDPNYLVFARTAALQKAGFARRALVPVKAFGEPEVANPVSKGIAELMARQALMGGWAIIPVWEPEPISLNVASQVRDHLAKEHIKSLIIVAPGFRSRRSSLVYHAMLDELGTRVYCAPVFGPTTPERWTKTWHGIQEVTEEFLKLQYYRFYVLPFLSRNGNAGLREQRTSGY